MNAYYEAMVKKNRLVPIYRKGKMRGFITFYITNNLYKFINSDSWSILDDNSYGTLCYVAQLITDKNPTNSKVSYKVWRDFKEFIKCEFPRVKTIYWRRWDRKSKEVKTYSKEVRNVYSDLHS